MLAVVKQWFPLVAAALLIIAGTVWLFVGEDVTVTEWAVACGGLVAVGLGGQFVVSRKAKG